MIDLRNLSIGEALKRYGYINNDVIESSLEYQKNHKEMRLGEILVSLGYIDEKVLLNFLAELIKTRVINLENFHVEFEAVKLLPKVIAVKYTVMAIECSGGTNIIVMNDPLNYYAIEDIRSFISDPIEIVISKKADIVRAIDYYYSELEVNAAAVKTQSISENAETAIFDFDLTEDDEAPVVKLVNTLLLRGYSAGASDIHIEPYEKDTVIRLRLDGIISEFLHINKSVHNALVARIKIVSTLDIAEKRKPQDGHFRYRLDGKNFDIRTSIVPTVFGEKVVLRFLNFVSRLDFEDSFGMKQRYYQSALRILQNPHGILYISGTTGSGKTTTLYMILEHLSRTNVSIATIEDPVEKNIPKVCQMQVNPAAGLTFQTGLRSLFRQDPDIMMVGETRDEETASISIRAAVTGHFVLSTIHTNNAVSTISRLIDMSIPPYMVSNALVGIVAQRLVRKICLDCKKSYEITDSEKTILGEDTGILYNGAGCRSCNYTGYKGRIAVHEIIEIDNNIKKMIIQQSPEHEIQDYCRNVKGLVLMSDEIANLVKEGITTTSEYYRVASCIV